MRCDKRINYEMVDFCEISFAAGNQEEKSLTQDK
jgi:hypothetical protein